MRFQRVSFAAALVGCGPLQEADQGSEELTVTLVRVDTIEDNAHAVWVNVGVSEPASVRVEFSQFGEPSLVTSWESEALRHRIPLVGLVGDADTTLVVHARTAHGEEAVGMADFKTSTAAEFLQPSVTGSLVGDGPTGWMYLLDETDRRTAVGASGPMRFVGVDQQGRLIWDHVSPYKAPGNAPFVEVLEGGHFFYRTATGGTEFNALGEEVWGFDLGVALHHDAERLPNGNWVVMAQTHDTIESEEFGVLTVVGDSLIEVDSSGSEVWRWELRDHLDWESTRTPFNEPMFGLNISDWTHANSVQYVRESDGFLVSLRHLSWIIFIDRMSGEILWTLGEGGDFALAQGTWFSGQHDAQLLADNQVLLYDNSLNQSLSESRGLKMELDFETMEVQILAEYPADAWALTMGGIRAVAGGGVLLTTGGHRSEGVPSTVLQVDSTGEEVLRLEQALTNQLNYRTGLYRYAEPM